MLLYSLLCKCGCNCHQLISLAALVCCCFLLAHGFLCFHPRLLLTASQAYADSDVDLFTWGTPITAIALFTILVHLGIETKTWVRNLSQTIRFNQKAQHTMSSSVCLCILSIPNSCLLSRFFYFSLGFIPFGIMLNYVTLEAPLKVS